MDDICSPYKEWVPAWKVHLAGSPADVRVSHEVTAITTPLNAMNWASLLSTHPNQELVQFFLTGISEGFRIGFKSSPKPLKSAKRNLECALQHPDTVSQYLAEEIAHHRVAGPFKRSTIPDAHINRLGVIPKNHQPNKWRLIIDLSHPASRSVNDGIPKNLCSLTYITVDSAIQRIQLLGQGTLLAKINVKNAFRLLPVHPSDRHLLAMDWVHSLYIDTCLPFGLRSAPKLFNVLTDLLSWILTQKGI